MGSRKSLTAPFLRAPAVLIKEIAWILENLNKHIKYVKTLRKASLLPAPDLSVTKIVIFSFFVFMAFMVSMALYYSLGSRIHLRNLKRIKFRPKSPC